jgi:hypothetical protein
MTRRTSVAASLACLGGFWYFLSRVEPQPKWLRWATWW